MTDVLLLFFLFRISFLSFSFFGAFAHPALSVCQTLVPGCARPALATASTTRVRKRCRRARGRMRAFRHGPARLFVRSTRPPNPPAIFALLILLPSVP